jgi:hypothetical protein
MKRHRGHAVENTSNRTPLLVCKYKLDECIEALDGAAKRKADVTPRMFQQLQALDNSIRENVDVELLNDLVHLPDQSSDLTIEDCVGHARQLRAALSAMIETEKFVFVFPSEHTEE